MSGDIVEWLRHVAWLAEEGSEVVDLATTAADEIVRLRAAGDALAINYELMLEQDWSSFLEAFLYEWKKARRG